MQHGEPYYPLHTGADRTAAGADLSLTEAGGEVPGLREHLQALDQMLDRRAASIEAELREIAQVRKRIKFYLAPGDGIIRAPLSSGLGGANLGQMI